jgi:hypothetical protein
MDVDFADIVAIEQYHTHPRQFREYPVEHFDPPLPLTMADEKFLGGLKQKLFDRLGRSVDLSINAVVALDDREEAVFRISGP